MKAFLIDKNDFEGFMAQEDGSIITIPLDKLSNANINSSLSCNSNLTSFNPVANHSNTSTNRINNL